MNAVLQDQPLPARLLPWPRALDTTLGRCLLLAALLHLWLAALLGNAPGGTAPPGQGVAGALNITLRGPARDGAAEPAPPAEALNRAPGTAATPRWGGTVRQTEPAPDSPPGAASLGLPAAQQPDAVPAPAAPVPVPIPARAAAPEPAPVPVPAPAPVTVPPAPVRAVPPAPVPPAQTAPPEPAAPPVPPAEAAEGRLRAASPLPAPAPAAPALAREAPLPAAVPLPEVPALPTAAPQLQRQLASPLTRPVAAPSQPLQPSSEGATAVALPALSPVPGVPGAPLPALGTAAPDAGTRVGQDVATPAAAASAPPRLNLQLARPRGGELSRYDTRGALPVLPRPPERDEKLAREIEKAGKADCRQAYSGMGPLAVIPLAVDALRKDGGCKW